jgi:hypothetical protein
MAFLTAMRSQNLGICTWPGRPLAAKAGTADKILSQPRIIGSIRFAAGKGEALEATGRRTDRQGSATGSNRARVALDAKPGSSSATAYRGLLPGNQKKEAYGPRRTSRNGFNRALATNRTNPNALTNLVRFENPDITPTQPWHGRTHRLWYLGSQPRDTPPIAHGSQSIGSSAASPGPGTDRALHPRLSTGWPTAFTRLHSAMPSHNPPTQLESPTSSHRSRPSNGPRTCAAWPCPYRHKRRNK